MNAHGVARWVTQHSRWGWAGPLGRHGRNASQHSHTQSRCRDSSERTKHEIYRSGLGKDNQQKGWPANHTTYTEPFQDLLVALATQQTSMVRACASHLAQLRGPRHRMALPKAARHPWPIDHSHGHWRSRQGSRSHRFYRCGNERVAVGGAAGTFNYNFIDNDGVERERVLGVVKLSRPVKDRFDWLID